jgi:hypothetical protein
MKMSKARLSRERSGAESGGRSEVMSYADEAVVSFNAFWGYGSGPADEVQRIRAKLDEARCPWCAHPVQRDVEWVAVPFDHRQSDTSLGVSDGLYQQLDRCVCGWWLYFESDGRENEHHSLATEGKLRTFDVGASDVPIAALNRYLSHPDRFGRLRDVDPSVMEKWVQELMRDHFQCEIRHLGGPGDDGVDLLAIVTDGPPIPIQVKRRMYGRSEPVSTIRDFLGAMVVGGHRRGLVVTSADRFTAPASQTARSVLQSGFQVDVLDFGDIKRLFDLTWTDRSTRGEQHWKNLSQRAERSLYRFGMVSAGHIDRRSPSPPPFIGQGGSSRTETMLDWVTRVRPLFMQQQRVLNTRPCDPIPYIGDDGLVHYERLRRA